MLRFYPAVIEKEPESDFGVSFPDFPGCVTAGNTLEGALAAAKEALALHLDGLLEDGDPLPNPSPPAPLLLDAMNRPVDPRRGEVYTLIEVRVPGRAKRINITLDDALLAQIDSETDNRSAFLDAAARAELARRRS